MSGTVIKLDQLRSTRGTSHGDKFQASIAAVGAGLGASKLGYNVTTVPPGKRAFANGTASRADMNIGPK